MTDEKPIDVWKRILDKDAKAIESCTDPNHKDCQQFGKFIEFAIDWFKQNEVDVVDGLKFLAALGHNCMIVLDRRYGIEPTDDFFEDYAEGMSARNFGKVLGHSHRTTAKVDHQIYEVRGNDPEMAEAIKNMIKVAHKTGSARRIDADADPEPPDGLSVPPGTKVGKA